MAIQINIEDNFIPYLVLIFNVLIASLARKISSKLLSKNLFSIINELISTLELCSCCAELTPVWELHGNYGIAISLFFLCICWYQLWGDAEACPCGPIEEILIMKKSITTPILLKKLFGQLLGAWLTWKYTSWIWCWHLSEQHHHLHETPCEATLYVTPLYGTIIEGLITFISRFVSLESEKLNNHNLSMIINSLTTVLLVLFALNSTGGFFNPIMASALMIGCKGNTYWEHFQVYWFGSIVGSLLARLIHNNLLNLNDNKKQLC